MLRGSQQAVISPCFENENSNSEASETDISLDAFAANPRLSQPQALVSNALVRPYAVDFNLTRSTCEQECSCACHQGSRIRSPSYLDAIFGSLMVGYSARLWMTHTCDSSNCRDRSTCITYTYAFPRWLFQRMIAFRIAYDWSKGPELCIRLLRVRSGPTNFFYGATMTGSATEAAIHHMKYLLANGEASVVDVDSCGRTALQASSKLSSPLVSTTDLTDSGLFAQKIMTLPLF